MAIGSAQTTGLTASVVSLKPMLSFARTCGVNTTALLSRVGLSESGLDNIDRRIQEADRAYLWREAAASSNDTEFGLHVMQHADVGAYDVLDYALCFSATLADLLARILRFHRILTDVWAIDLQLRSGAAHIRRSYPTTDRQESEAFSALLYLRMRAVTRSKVTLQRVRFMHGAPENVRPVSSVFACPVQFACAASELVLDARDLALPVRNANSGLTVILDRYMQDLLDRLPHSDEFVHRVHRVVSKALHGGDATLSSTARALRTSTRTVQRHLRDNGTSHRQVVDAVRRDLAERLVVAGQLSITEIAFLVGFSEVSGFRRTFKRWTGVSPSEMRRRRA